MSAPHARLAPLASRTASTRSPTSMPVTRSCSSTTPCALAAWRKSEARLGGVEPALPRGAEGAGGHALDRQPGEPARQLDGIKERYVGAMDLLKRDILRQQRAAVLAGQDEIALLAEAHVGLGSEHGLQLPDQ